LGRLKVVRDFVPGVGLVPLGVQHVVPAGIEHFPGVIAVGEYRVSGHAAALKRGQQAQQPQARLVLVGGGIDRHLGDDGGRLGDVSGDQVQAGDIAILGAAKHLAVDGDGGVGRQPAVGEPSPDDGIELVGIENAEDVGEGVGAGHVGVAKSECVSEGFAAGASEVGDGDEGGVPGKESEDGELEESDKGIGATSGVAGVGEIGQVFSKRASHETPPDRQEPFTQTASIC
jgi:hypothetical protein